MTVRSVIATGALAALFVARPVAATPGPGDGPLPPGVVLPPVPAKPGASAAPFAGAPLTRVLPGRRNARAESGALRGKTVYVAAGHGYYFDTGLGYWTTQRGNTHDLVEDFITAETVDQYLIPYLQAMGAYVVPIREADLNAQAVVVDDGDATIEGTIAELANTAGWGPLPVPYTGTENAFKLGDARAMTASADETGRVVYATAVPTSGYYNVYFSYVQGADRVSDAHVIVRHAGGESAVQIDQRRHGGTWMLLGRWYFEAGAPVERASIVVTNASADAGKVVSFDAVRLGGGMAPHVRGGVTTTRPAYESAARYSTQLLGAPSSVYGPTGDERQDDVGARPRFAAWEHEAGEDAIYVALHTNAPSPNRGTLTLAYGPTYPCCGPLSEFSGVAGSLELLNAVHDEVMSDVRADWDPNWVDAGKGTASLGELRPGNNGEMPAILIEIAFHDTTADAEALRDPRYRRVTTRAIAEGIAKYFATKDGTPLVLPPEPVTNVSVVSTGDGGLRVTWRPPAADAHGGDAPTSYRVHLSDNGYGFDDGVEVDGDSYTFAGVPKGVPQYVRVTAVNAGGESPPSEVVAACVTGDGRPPVLLVGGFDRLDKSQMVRDAAPGIPGELDRMWLEHMNNGTLAVPHAIAIAGAGYGFDGATDDAVEAQDLDIAAYRAIDWFVGNDAGEQQPMAAATRPELARFFLAGGGLLLSGSELVASLQASSTAEDPAFASDVLHASLVADDAETYDVTPDGDPFADLGAFTFADDRPLGYDVKLPDVIAPEHGANAVLRYATGGAAGIAWDDGSSKGIVVGFPIEAIADDATRTTLIARAFAAFGVTPDSGGGGDGGGDDEPTTCGCGAGGSGALPGLLVAGLFLARRRRATRSSRAA